MVFTCKACGAALKESDIRFDSGIATCGHCQAVMSFAEELKVAPPKPSAKREKPKVGRPESIDIEDTPVRLKLSRRWYHPGLFFMLFFCIAWDAFLVGWYVMGSQMPDAGPVKFIMLLFPIAHVAVGVGLTYSVIAGFLNRTTVEVSSSELSVRHGPIPWKGNQRHVASDIVQLYCKGRSVATRGHSHTQVSKLAPSLYAKLRDDRSVKLLGKAGDLETLLYIERRVEERLGIRDEAVAGEITH